MTNKCHIASVLFLTLGSIAATGLMYATTMGSSVENI